MNKDVRELSPGSIWNYFADLNAVPRPSKKETAVISFMKSFGESLGLSTYVDEAGNVIIKKPASKGMENRLPIILQSHLDMVHQKNSDRTFDFNVQGIEMIVSGDWVKADGTTLGADNGIGVATIMSILSSHDISQPAIEALFTIDEETGMTGALALKANLLDGRILLNLDTEEDNELTIGCAGGIDVSASGEYSMVDAEENGAYKITVKGLTGGHSGVDIYKGRANANKLMNRLLYEMSLVSDFSIASIDGGSLRNAIPRESVAEIFVQEADSDNVKKIIARYNDIFKAEYHATDPNLIVVVEKSGEKLKVLSREFQQKFLRAMYACPNGIYRMSPGIEGLVQTSNNIARVLVKEGSYVIQCLSRSAVDSEKTDLVNSITAAFELCGAAVSPGSSYPGWEPKPDAPIVKLMTGLYKEMFNEDAHVSAIHAGLECGILGTNYPGMQMISFGPNIIGAHSPDEKVQISSVQKFWKYLLETLKRIPANA